MCGISGIINFKGVSERDIYNIKRMVSIQDHRGPDFNQIKQLSENGIFGHNRLSMMDLCDDILIKVDRASMINSLEVRVPLLDYRLIEFSFKKIGSKFKTVNNTQKYLMKKLALHLLGRKYYDVNRSRKQGYGIRNVLSKWFEPNG